MSNILIPHDISKKILMIGVFYKHNAPGGMAAVVQYYSDYIEDINYIASWKKTNIVGRVFIGITAYFKILFQLIFNRQIKILHIHTAADGSYWRKSKFMKLGKLFGKKIILHVHSSRFKDFYNECSNKQKMISNLMIADKLIVLSQSWKEWFIKIGIPESKLVILNNITNYPIETPKKSDNKKHLLFLGELCKRKGIFDILQAIANNPDLFRDKIELRIGGNTNEDKLLSFIQTNNLQDFVFFEGWVAEEKKRELLNWADIYILPSFNEGLPIGILEAMSYGCAIISSPVGGIPEVVIPQKNGILVKPGNIDEITNAIVLLANDTSLVNKYSSESKKIVEPYLPKQVLINLKYIYENITI